MEPIAATQADAGLTPELFCAVARIYADLAVRGMADAPENVPDDIALDVSCAVYQKAQPRMTHERGDEPGRVPYRGP